jgi:hypothetical protein
MIIINEAISARIRIIPHVVFQVSSVRLID